MKLTIKVTPGAKKNEFKQEGDLIKVYLTAPAVEGKANEALIKFLAEYFQVRNSAIEILKGLKSRHKVVNIIGI
jgi:uncharacterized protein (TIGR00251 family)